MFERKIGRMLLDPGALLQRGMDARLGGLQALQRGGFAHLDGDAADLRGQPVGRRLALLGTDQRDDHRIPDRPAPFDAVTWAHR
jgi:hypothetical protein